MPDYLVEILRPHVGIVAYRRTFAADVQALTRCELVEENARVGDSITAWELDPQRKWDAGVVTVSAFGREVTPR